MLSAEEAYKIACEFRGAELPRVAIDAGDKWVFEIHGDERGKIGPRPTGVRKNEHHAYVLTIREACAVFGNKKIKKIAIKEPSPAKKA